MENVPQVHADQNIIDFENWQKFLMSIGYYNFCKDLNAKDYGIPQNRERCFMVSILSDEFIEYDFPKGVKLEKVMKDFLEEQVDEKYYINSEKADKLITELIESGVLPEQNRTEQNRTEQNRTEQNRTEQNRTEQNRTEQNRTACAQLTVCVKNMIDKNAKPEAKAIDVATTLMARDYKGMNNYGANGVIQQLI